MVRQLFPGRASALRLGEEGVSWQVPLGMTLIGEHPRMNKQVLMCGRWAPLQNAEGLMLCKCWQGTGQLIMPMIHHQA